MRIKVPVVTLLPVVLAESAALITAWVEAELRSSSGGM